MVLYNKYVVTLHRESHFLSIKFKGCKCLNNCQWFLCAPIFVVYRICWVVAPGGKLIIYAPHITEVSRTWGEYMDKIGYHTVDYFLEQPDKFTDIPRGVLAHSTHVRGIGKMEEGVEKPRIEVILASSLSEEECRRINLGYMDYREIDLDMYKNTEDEGVFFVDKAGEVLHRVKNEE